MNFKGFGNEALSDGDGGGIVGGGGGRQIPGMHSSLARQTSIYSLTFDELQNTLGAGGGGGTGTGKDFGSMNMDELLKNIWTVEETQTMGGLVGTASIPGAQGVGNGGGVSGSGGYLQRQGSLTLPRTLSQKTVDEVWRDMSKENDSVGSISSVNLAANLQKRQRTLGEMTLEDFLVKAGVVRENMPLTGNKPNNGGLYGELSLSSNNGLGIGFQQAGQGIGLLGNQIPDATNQISMQSPNLPLNFNGVRVTRQPFPQLQAQPLQQVPVATQQIQQQLFPEQGGIAAYTTPIPQLGSPKIRGGLVGFPDQGFAGGMGMSGLGAAGAVTIANVSPALSSDEIVGKGNNGYASSVSPVPYVFSGGVRGRKSGTVEKVIERRHRRMIKNRESAARSRARKQAYTVELETEIAKLKEENDKLRQKQEEIMEEQKNQELEMMNRQVVGKKQCLRRTQTGPW